MLKKRVGSGDNEDHFQPILLFNQPNIKFMHCGQNHSILYNSNGEFFIWGFKINKNKKLKIN